MSSEPNNNEDKTTKPTTPEKVTVDPRAISAILLHNQGLTTEQIASAYFVTVRTVQRWIKELKEEHHDMIFPNVDALKKRLQALGPNSIDTFEYFMKNKLMFAPQAMKSAENILKTFNVVVDKVVIIEESSKLSDDELIEQANALKQGKNV